MRPPVPNVARAPEDGVLNHVHGSHRDAVRAEVGKRHRDDCAARGRQLPRHRDKAWLVHTAAVNTGKDDERRTARVCGPIDARRDGDRARRHRHVHGGNVVTRDRQPRADVRRRAGEVQQERGAADVRRGEPVRNTAESARDDQQTQDAGAARGHPGNNSGSDMAERRLIIAIDGPSGAGKGTVARTLADALVVHARGHRIDVSRRRVAGRSSRSGSPG